MKMILSQILSMVLNSLTQSPYINIFLLSFRNFNLSFIISDKVSLVFLYMHIPMCTLIIRKPQWTKVGFKYFKLY